MKRAGRMNMKLSHDDQRRLRKALRLTYQTRVNSLRENWSAVDIEPKRGGHAFGKKRSFHES
jgi:hypothetical protein